MMLCVYGVFDTSDGSWIVHLRGAGTIAKEYSLVLGLSPFLRSWLLYHEVLSQFSLSASDEIEAKALPIPHPSRDKSVVSICLIITVKYLLI